VDTSYLVVGIFELALGVLGPLTFAGLIPFEKAVIRNWSGLDRDTIRLLLLVGGLFIMAIGFSDLYIGLG